MTVLSSDQPNGMSGVEESGRQIRRTVWWGKAFHELLDRPPGFGLRQPSRLRGAPKRRFGATAAGALNTSKAAWRFASRRSPRRFCAEPGLLRFRVREQFQNEQETTDEPARDETRPTHFGIYGASSNLARHQDGALGLRCGFYDRVVVRTLDFDLIARSERPRSQ